MTRPWRHLRRIEISPEQLGVPDVSLFGRYNYTHAEPGLSPHAHPQSMEFCFLVRGRQSYRVGNRTYPLSGGDAFVTFPDEPHSTGDAPEEKGVLYWIIVRIPATGENFLGLSGAPAAALREALVNLPVRRFRSSKRVLLHLDGVVNEYFSKKNPLRSTRLQNHLIAVLIETVQAAHLRPHHTPQTRATLEHLTRMIETRLPEPIPLSVLAGAARLSLPRFKVWFKEQTGVPPGEYILRRRVELARQHLAGTETPITDLGFSLGFSSSQYFATVMKRYTGHTPQQIRRLARAGVKSRDV